MTIIKTPMYKDFSIVPNGISRDRLLSFESRGLLVYMRSLPTNWQFRMDSLVKEAPNCRKEKLQKLVKELENAGYIIRKKNRNEKGHFTGIIWIVSQERDYEKTAQALKKAGKKPDGGQSHQTEKPVDIISKELNNSSSNIYTHEKILNFPNKKFQDESEKFFHSVLSEIQLMLKKNQEVLTNEVKWYIEMKIEEYINRYPQNSSKADCCRYVLQAVKKKTH